MKGLLLVIVLSWAQTGRGNQLECVPIRCGCQLHSTKGTLDISLDSLGPLQAVDNSSNAYTFGGCGVDINCTSESAVVCKEDGSGQKSSIGLRELVTYNVLTSAGIQAVYNGSSTAIVHLVCGNDAVNPLFDILSVEDRIYVFELKFDKFCYHDDLAADPSTVSSTLGSASTIMSTTPLASIVTATANQTSAMLSTLKSASPVMSTLPSSIVKPTATPTTETSALPLTNNTVSVISTSLVPIETSHLVPPPTLQPTEITVNASSVFFSTSKPASHVVPPVQSTTAAVPINPVPGKENKDEKERKVVLAIVLSLVGAVVVACTLIIIFYFVWRNKRSRYVKIN